MDTSMNNKQLNIVQRMVKKNLEHKLLGNELKLKI